MIKEVIGVYFSPSGGTAKITKKIAKEMAGKLDEICVSDISFSFIDLLRNPESVTGRFSDETVVVMGLPVFSGRIPQVCIKLMDNMKGQGALSVVTVTYGNNSYGDALYELYSKAEDRGFGVISAGAFVAQHSIIKKVAEDRPDAFDLEKILEFSNVSANKIKRMAGTEITNLKAKPAPLDIKGSIPTKNPLRLPIHPTANSFCIKCGKCAKVCPTGAIDKNRPNVVNNKRCISCTACIAECEQGARDFRGPLVAASKIALEKLFSKRKDPEWFI